MFSKTILTAMLALLPTALADFQIVNEYTFGAYQRSYAIAQNALNCNCLQGNCGVSRAGVNSYGNEVELPKTSFFYTESNLCGAGRLNFYLDSSKKFYTFFANNGNGQALGKCYASSGAYDCSAYAGFSEYSDQDNYVHHLYCSGYLCK